MFLQPRHFRGGRSGVWSAGTGAVFGGQKKVIDDDEARVTHGRCHREAVVAALRKHLERLLLLRCRQTLGYDPAGLGQKVASGIEPVVAARGVVIAKRHIDGHAGKEARSSPITKLRVFRTKA